MEACPTKKIRYHSFTDAVSHAQMPQPGELPNIRQPAVWKCDQCGCWHVATEAKALEVTAPPPLAQRN